MQQFDVVILGAGFGGSLTALLLDRIGLSVALIDRGTHPRFAIGESSTPAAGYLLQSLAAQYDLPQFEPFCKYGTWQQAHPDISCGIKRGFSYFAHTPHQPFQTQPAHGSELLVTANLCDTLADTHWYRADVDHWFARQVAASGIVYRDQTEVELQHNAPGWRILGTRLGERIDLQANFLIDATGAAGIVARALGIEAETDFKTHSSAIFGHFRNVAPWQTILNGQGISREDYPFNCDHSALHHVLDEGWMWQLRFNNGITSAGFVLDGETGQQNWETLLDRYPSIQAQFVSAECVDPEDGLQTTGRLQRGWKECAGPDWALLPHTAGFIDPLHSTGIAHTLCGIERLVTVLEQHTGQGTLTEALATYSHSLQTERTLIDTLVACCYRSRHDFERFWLSTLFYFAAATSYEHLRFHKQQRPWLLCADDERFRQTVADWYQLVSRQDHSAGHKTDWLQTARELLAPWDQVGLFEPAVPHMYYYTAAPEAEPR